MFVCEKMQEKVILLSVLRKKDAKLEEEHRRLEDQHAELQKQLREYMGKRWATGRHVLRVGKMLEARDRKMRAIFRKTVPLRERIQQLDEEIKTLANRVDVD